jgi:hypothetical protein
MAFMAGSLEAVHQLMVDGLQVFAAGLAEMQKVWGLLVRRQGLLVTPLLDHHEHMGVLLVAVQVVLQAAVFAAAGVDQHTQAGFYGRLLCRVGGEGGNQGQRGGHGQAPGGTAERVTMLVYLAGKKNSV